MQIYKNITVAKATDGGLESKLPTHRLVVTDEKFQNKKDVGAFWTKEGNYGKFLSGKMGNARNYTNKEGASVDIPGYVIVREDELNALLQSQSGETLADIAETKEKMSFTPNVSETPEDIPF